MFSGTKIQVFHSLFFSVENFLDEENRCAKFSIEPNSWIPVRSLKNSKMFSSIRYETIVEALRQGKSSKIETKFFEPISIRYRSEKSDFHRTVVVDGLPDEIKFTQAFAFFNRFYPVKNVEKVKNDPMKTRINVIFQKSSQARAFVQTSKEKPIVFTSQDNLQKSHGFTIVCRMLGDLSCQMAPLFPQEEQIKPIRRIPGRVSFKSKFPSSSIEIRWFHHDVKGIQRFRFHLSIMENLIIKWESNFMEESRNKKNSLQSSIWSGWACLGRVRVLLDPSGVRIFVAEIGSWSIAPEMIQTGLR